MDISRQELAKKWTKEHINNINNIFNTDIDSYDYDLLLELEEYAHTKAEEFCEYYEEAWVEAEEEYILNKLFKILNVAHNKNVFWNRDPRGYALKIEDDYIRNNKLDIWRDMGGYGIIAPVING
jgi:hypothetical protein